jgi:predicted nucleic acid-binding protein
MVRLLSAGQIVMHPFIVAEIALGSLKSQRKKLADLDLLLSVRHTLYSKGIGLTDAHLAASCLLNPGTQLWTRDAKLERVVKALGILFDPL